MYANASNGMHSPATHEPVVDFDPPNMTIGLATATTTSLADFDSNLSSIGLSDAADLPTNFDWRKEPGVELSIPITQGSCGNCWAVSSTGSFGDRWMIATGHNGLVLNPLPTTVCGKPGKACAGGLPESAQPYFENNGASSSQLDDACLTWTDYCADDKCCNGCGHGTPMQSMPDIACGNTGCTGKFFAQPGSMRSGTVINEKTGQVDMEKTIHSIKTDIKLHGPVVSKYRVYGDFMYSNNPSMVTAAGHSMDWSTTNDIYKHGEYLHVFDKFFKNLAENPPVGASQEKIDIWAQGLMPTGKPGAMTNPLTYFTLTLKMYNTKWHSYAAPPP